jgi:cobalamin biosynthesis Mg chelatase CobN
MAHDHNNNDNSNHELEIVIRDIKLEFRKLISKRKQLIQKLGNAFEKVVSDRESICEEIKNTLKEEIAEGIISARLIESYCPTEWKRKTKPKTEKKAKPENEKTSFSHAQGQSPQHEEQILVTNQGSSTAYKEPSTNTQTTTKRPDSSSHEHNEPSKNAQARDSEEDYSQFQFFIPYMDILIHINSLITQDRQDAIRFKGVLNKRTGEVISAMIAESGQQNTITEKQFKG